MNNGLLLHRRKKIIQLLGASIWCPSLAISVAGIWGVQLILVISVYYLFSVLIAKRSNSKRNQVIGMLGMFFLSFLLVISSMTGALPFFRGVLSALSELTLLVVAYAIYHDILTEPLGGRYLMNGYYFGAIASALIAIMQFVGLNLGLELFAWELVNPSFTLFTSNSAMLHQRAYALTPEPSVLGGLLLSAVAIQATRAKYFASHKEWMLLGLFVIAMGTTASQGLIFLPLAIFLGFFCISNCIHSSKRKYLGWFYGIAFVLFMLVAFFSIESLQRNFVVRMVEIFTDTGEKTSYSARSETIFASLRMFSESPILGAGPGASTDLLEKYANTDDEVAAASAFIRYLAELGVFYISIWIILFCKIIYLGYKERAKNDLLRAQFFLIAFWFCISAMFFVGYRTLYQNSIWMGIALALYQTSQLKKKKSLAFL